MFSTESGVEYSVHFTEEFAIGECDTYQFMFSKLTKDHVPFDLKISQTLIVIIEEFFRANHNVLLYICDTSDNREHRATDFLQIGLEGLLSAGLTSFARLTQA